VITSCGLFTTINASITLLLGVCNPRGESNTYNGLYFTRAELMEIVHTRSLCGTPVKIEHSGAPVGEIISAYLDDSEALNCVMHIPEDNYRADILAGFVRDGVALDLSMGYTIDVRHAQNRTGYVAGRKNTVEVSVVRKGARDGCHIVAYETPQSQIHFPGKHASHIRARNSWREFGLDFK
jgi:hypothetical protein